MALLIRNASEIVTMKNGWNVVRNGSLFIDQGKIMAIGKIRKYPRRTRILDATGCTVLPGFVDSHTHLVFAGSREDEFALRVRGASYEEIAKAGGGIRRSVRMTTKSSEDELYRIGAARLTRIAQHGTTTIEIKSGYGLSMAGELKMLRAIRRLAAYSVLDIVPTYLVHAVPPGIRRRAYVGKVIQDIIPQVARQRLAVFCDVFCDRIAFTIRETEQILRTAHQHGLKLKLHADQFADIGATALAARMRCVSVDHLECTKAQHIPALKKAGVVPTLLPGVSLYLAMKKKPPVRAFERHGLPFAIASDFNPGSCAIYAMPKIISLACLLFGTSVEDAIAGATVHGARALGMLESIGTLEPGKQADIVVCEVDNYKKIPYYFGEDIVSFTIKKGRCIYGKNR
jgi:imidazolonepropionase